MKLAKLLGESDKDTAKIIDKLEYLSGYNSEDVRLLVDIKKQTARKIAELGLDPADTTGQELYHALQAKLAADSAKLAEELNFSPSDGIDACTSKLAASVASLPQPEVLAIKHSAAKSLLRSNPPKKLMKKLNYRSLESMLKRAVIEELFATAPVTESAAWQKKMAKAIAKLKAADFEPVKVKYIVLPSTKWSAQADRPVTDVPLMGAVAIWPSRLFLRKEGLLCALTILQAVEIIETDDFYLRNNQFKSDFGQIASKLYINGEVESPSGDSFFGWGHLKSLDKSVETSLDKLARIHPALGWWQDARHLSLVDEEPVSLNLGDNLKSYLSGANYEQRHLGGLAHRLKTELLNRYAGYEGVNNYFMNQFDDTLIAVENELGAEPAFEYETVS